MMISLMILSYNHSVFFIEKNIYLFYNYNWGVDMNLIIKKDKYSIFGFGNIYVLIS